MGILSLASGQSAYRGYEYYKEKKVVALQKRGDDFYDGIVAGSNGAQYKVHLDLTHPRQSKCSCPHAAGRRVICKHIVAAYFAVYPQEAEQYRKDLEAAWEAEEQEAAELEEQIVARVRRMKKAELQEVVLQFLFDGPEWQYDRFVREYMYD